MKPVNLIAYPIKNSSMSSALVLDPFGGSGSTLMACDQMDRIAALCELDPKFCDVIVNRYAESKGSTEGIKLVRDGKEISYEEAAKKTSENTEK